MKKSTLITTIAMIVVVVVALSTATYAWFTSAGQTYAKQTIQTAATENLTVATSTTMIQNAAEDQANFVGLNFLEKTYNNGTDQDGLRAGLWAPVLEGASTSIEETALSTAIDTKVSDLVSFVQGTQNKAGTEAKWDIAATAMSPDLIRVTNNLAKTQVVTLTIFIGAADTSNSYQAGRGVSFYLDVVDGSDTHTQKNSQYGYLNGSVGNSTAVGTVAINSTNFIKVNASAEGVSAGTNHAASPATVDEGYTASNSTYTTAGGNKAKFYTITVTLGDWAPTESKNILIYNWLDGTFLSDSAASADIDISYMFSSVDKA